MSKSSINIRVPGCNGPVQEICAEGARRLGAAIVIRAVADYRMNLRMLKRSPEDAEAARRMERIEKFIGSETCELYSNLDADYMLKKLKQIKEKMLEV